MDAYAWIQGLLRLAVRAFFRRVEVVGLESVPKDGGGLLVAWHPNGLVDPGLILTQFDRPVVFGARHGLFGYPVLGELLRQVGTVPIYRAMDAKGRRNADPREAAQARRVANKKSLEALASRIGAGSFSALFPEGDSHDESDLQVLKTGAARLYYRARQLTKDGASAPVIVPVGLHYDAKQMFRSNALVAFHPALSLPEDLDVTPDYEPEDPAFRELCRRLTDHLEVALREANLGTEDWRLHHLMHRAGRLIRAERFAVADLKPDRTTIMERVRMFGKIRRGYYALQQQSPDTHTALLRDVTEYDVELRALGLQDYDLDRSPSFVSKWIAALLVLQFVGVFVFLPAFVMFGYIANLPTAGLIVAAAKVAGKKRKDEATIKLLLGLVLFPLTWIAVGIVGWIAHYQLNLVVPRVPNTPILAGTTLALIAAAGGIAGMRYWRFARDTARSVRVRLTRRRFRLSVSRLRKIRRDLHDRLMAVADLGVSDAENGD